MTIAQRIRAFLRRVLDIRSPCEDASEAGVAMSDMLAEGIAQAEADQRELGPEAALVAALLALEPHLPQLRRMSCAAMLRGWECDEDREDWEELN